jgi:predicted HTH domain antitoxin
VSAKLTLPEDFLVASGLTESDCLIELAVHLCARRRISVEQAVRLSGLSREEFDDAFEKREP